MLPLIINVAHVLITVNSSPRGVPAVFWALSHRKCCPVPFVRKAPGTKKLRTRPHSVFVYFRGEGLQLHGTNMMVVFYGMTKVFEVSVM